MNEEINKETLEKYLFDENLDEEVMTVRQQQIIDAAIKIFSQKGFEGSRTSDIAKEAEVAEGTIFRYYKTKKDLLLGLLLPLITKFCRPLIFRSLEKILKNPEKKSIDEVMFNILADRLELARKNMPLLKTVLIESTYHPELLEQLQKNIAPQLVPVVNVFMEEQMKNGSIRELEPYVVTRTLLSSMVGYIFLSNVLPEQFAGENETEELKKIVDILLNGIRKK